MSTPFVEDVKSKTAGFSFRYENMPALIQKASTVTEMLHLVHFYITNNDEILWGLPVVDSKSNGDDSYTMFGEETKVGRRIFDAINEKTTPMGNTAIVCLKDRTLLMARDMGHALMVDIEHNDDYYMARYFIPKICNVYQVNALKGIHPVPMPKKEEEAVLIDTGATGEFEIDNIDNIGQEVVKDFIEKVPTDSEMEAAFQTFRKEKIEEEKAMALYQRGTSFLKGFPQKSFEILSKLFDYAKEKLSKRTKNENEKDDVKR